MRSAHQLPVDVSGPRLGRFRERLIGSPHLVFWSTALTVVAIAFTRARVLFSQAVYPSGDAAVNSLLVIRAEHLQQLVGNYSRVGFHHPGPVFLYVLGAGEVLLHDVLRLGPTPYNAQLLGTSVYVAVMIGLVAVCVFRSFHSLGAAACAAVICFLLMARFGVFAQDWFPYLYMSAFLLFMVSGAAVAAGRTRELPLYVLAAAMLVHGHVSFILFVGVTTLAVSVAWWRGHRRAVGVELAAHRRGTIGSLAVLVLFALPLLVTTVRHFPEPWRGYLHFATHGHREPRSLGDVIHFVSGYWTDVRLPLAVFAVAAVSAVALTLTEKDADRRRVFVCLYAMLLLQSALTVYYVYRGVDYLDPRTTFGYVGFFYLVVPVLGLVTAAVQVWLRAAGFADSHGPVAHLAAKAAAPLLLTALLITAATRPELRFDPSSGEFDKSESFVHTAQVLKSSPERGTRRIALVPVDNTSWSALAGVATELKREGLPFCVDEAYPVWRNMFTPAFACDNSHDDWRIAVVIDLQRPVSRTLWKGVAGGRLTTVYPLED